MCILLTLVAEQVGVSVFDGVVCELCDCDMYIYVYAT